MKEMLTFDDVLIVPKFSTVNSRKEVDLSSDKLSLKLPILSANMDTVTGVDMAVAMHKAGGMGVLHRFWSIEDNLKAFQECFEKNKSEVMCSFGVGDKEFERFKKLADNGVLFYTLDVAHGAQLQVVKQYARCKEYFENAFIAVGNFATGESIKQFVNHLGYKPDAVKINIGSGSSCETRIKTGCGVPQLSSLLDCDTVGIPMIADGGMKTSGDCAKALAVNNVIALMTGGLLAGTTETPGSILGPKVYRGSASKESYKDQCKDWECAEGIAFTVPHKGPVSKVLADIEGGLKSAFSYVGARNLKEFKEKAEFVRITNSGVRENSAHGKQ
jgi:IMP dehydrogenase